MLQLNRLITWFLVLVSASACSFKLKTIEAERIEGGIKLNLSESYVGLSRSRVFEFGGGVPPYSLSVVGEGSAEFVDSTSFRYSAPTSIPSNTSAETVLLSDAIGQETVLTVRVATPGSPDLSFGVGGTATLDFAGGDDYGRGVIIQSDGKIVVAGSSHNGTQNVITVARFLENGSPDPSFGMSGRVSISPLGTSDLAYTLQQQSDGKIIVCGQTISASTQGDFLALRLDQGGVLDPTFGTGGISVVSLSALSDRAFTLAIQSDDMIILGGGARPTGSNGEDFTMIRLTKDGSLDSTFGVSGVFTIVNAGSDHVKSIRVLADGKILASGKLGSDFGVVRLTSDGVLDASFASAGIFRDPAGLGTGTAEEISVASDGKIVVGGTTAPDPADHILFRLTTSGSLDASYGAGGKRVFDFGFGNDRLFGIHELSDGGIVGAGTTSNGVNDDISVCRLNANGALDSQFNGSGKLLIPIGVGEDQSRQIREDALGRILVAGYSFNGANRDFVLLRYWP